jgi:uncharacterized protein YfbU (UPF0304 family)
MAFTTAEKLMIAMLCDLAKPPKQRELDFDFIWDSVMDDDAWALAWQHTGLQLDEKTPPDVNRVADLLQMWDVLERSFEALSPAEQKRVSDEPTVLGSVKFVGFDGNNETRLMHIARIFTRKLDRWERFKDRDLNSHAPTIDSYARMHRAFEPMWDAMVKSSGPYDLSADQIIAVMRERVHPENRVPGPGGAWTLKPLSPTP